MRSISSSSPLAQLLSTFPRYGELRWIGLRPAREQPIQTVETAKLQIGGGLVGDRYKGNAESKRQVTLIQAEHLAVIGALMGVERVDPALLRRNLLISGLNLLALQRSQFRIGSTLLEGTGQCHPCSRMESWLGPGGYNAMRGHGGITAKVIEAGEISVGDVVRYEGDRVTR
jgi:MOSC domain-containing protein YiiM